MAERTQGNAREVSQHGMQNVPAVAQRYLKRVRKLGMSFLRPVDHPEASQETPGVSLSVGYPLFPI